LIIDCFVIDYLQLLETPKPAVSFKNRLSIINNQLLASYFMNSMLTFILAKFFEL